MDTVLWIIVAILIIIVCLGFGFGYFEIVQWLCDIGVLHRCGDPSLYGSFVMLLA